MLNVETRCGKAWSQQPEWLYWPWVTLTVLPGGRVAHTGAHSAARTVPGWVPGSASWQLHAGAVINAHPASLEVSLIKYDLVARAQCPVGGTDVEGMMLGLRHCALEGQERLCVCLY